MLWRTRRFSAASLCLWLTILTGGCTVTVPYENRAIQKTLLQEAGFRLVDAANPKRQELMEATPKRQFVSYQVEGGKYYVYADEFNLYLGDEAAYQKYLSMVKDQRLCQSLDATDWGPFWSCFEEYQKGGARK